jgi:hypothetical protein
VDQDLPHPRRIAPAALRRVLRGERIGPRNRARGHDGYGRCDLCWRYGNPREFAEVRIGGRKNAYLGTCLECAAEGS